MDKQMQNLKKKNESFWSDFKAFITKGNVLDLAVGVVIGSAFGAITSGLVNYVINPVIALLTGGISVEGLRTPLGDPLVNAETGEKVLDELGNLTYANYIEWGLWIQTIINFFIIAFSIFVAVRVIRNAERRLRAKQIAADEAAAAAKKAADDEAAAKASADAKAAADAKKAIEDEFYNNVREQTALLREIREKLNK